MSRLDDRDLEEIRERGYEDGLQEGERRLYKKLQAEYARGWSEGIKQMNQEGEKRGWEMGREAAAGWHDNEAALARKRLGNLFSQKRENDVKEYALQQEFEAAAIRKLKKP